MTAQEQADQYTKQALIDCAHAQLFGPGNAQLPNSPMLMFDRITHISSTGGTHNKGHMLAELDINPDLWFFKCHFIGDPVMPGCLGLDALWQMAGFHLAWQGNEGKGRALGCSEVRFTGQITPDCSLVTYQLDVKRSIAGKTKLIIADGTVSCDGKIIYTAKNLKVGLFTNLNLGTGNE